MEQLRTNLPPPPHGVPRRSMSGARDESYMIRLDPHTSWRIIEAALG